MGRKIITTCLLGIAFGCSPSVEWDDSLRLPDAPDGTVNPGLAGAYSGIIGNTLFVAGGANFPDSPPWEGGNKKWWATLYLYDFAAREWRTTENFLDTPKAYGTSIAIDDAVLLIGGCDAAKCYSDVDMIRIEGHRAVLVKNAYPDLPVPLANCCGVRIGDVIYIMGGQERMTGERSTGNFFMLDLGAVDPSWEVLSQWPGMGRGYGVAAACGGKLYLFSGRSYGPSQPTVIHRDGYCFDPQTGCWRLLEGDFPVMAASATPYGGDRIVFWGGVERILPSDAGHPGFSHTVRVFDPETGRATILAESPYVLAVTTNAISQGEHVYIVSGEQRPGIRTPVILKATPRL